MTLRLVLVSLVAALGFTIPGTPVIESWVASTQDRINARFADWDTRNLPSTDEIGRKDHILNCLLTRRPSRLSETVNTPEALSGSVKKTPPIVEALRTPHLQPVKCIPKRVVSEAFEIGEKPLSDVAFRLDAHNRPVRTTTLEGPPAPFAALVKFNAASALGNVARQWTASCKTWASSIARSLPLFDLAGTPHPRTDPAPRMRTLITNFVTQPKSESQGPSIKSEQAGVSRCPASNPESFGAMEQSESLYFAVDLPQASERLVITPPASKNCLPGMASSAAVCSIAAPALAVVDDVYEEMTGCLRPFEDGFSHPVAKPAVEPRAPAAPGTQSVTRVSKEVAKVALRRTIKPRFEPTEVGEDQLTDITFNPTPPVNGGKSASVRPETAVAPATISPPMVTIEAQGVPIRLAPDLSRALKLTREAAYAWVNVLTGPAMVTVAQPNSNRVQ